MKRQVFFSLFRCRRPKALRQSAWYGRSATALLAGTARDEPGAVRGEPACALARFDVTLFRVLGPLVFERPRCWCRRYSSHRGFPVHQSGPGIRAPTGLADGFELMSRSRPATDCQAIHPRSDGSPAPRRRKIRRGFGCIELCRLAPDSGRGQLNHSPGAGVNHCRPQNTSRTSTHCQRRVAPRSSIRCHSRKEQRYRCTAATTCSSPTPRCPCARSRSPRPGPKRERRAMRTWTPYVVCEVGASYEARQWSTRCSAAGQS